MRTNCKNCGAPINVDHKACQYCHTPYFVPRHSDDMDYNYRLTSLNAVNHYSDQMIRTMNEAMIRTTFTSNDLRNLILKGD